MCEADLSIAPLATNEEAPFHLLELADPSKALIESYLENGTCHVAKIGSEMVGVMVLLPLDEASIEIKNIAVKDVQQGKGIGKALLQYAEEYGRKEGFKELIIGTGNSSVHQLALYQKEGFEVDRIAKDFFLKNYHQPIYENGIQCKDMIILTKTLYPLA